MARMKDRNTFPPHGWQWLESQTSWNAPANSSFDVVVMALIEHRKANKWITEQNNLPTEYDAVADQIDSYNAERMLRSGWNHFLSEASPNPQWMPQRLNRAAGLVVASVKKTAAGIKVISDWLGSGLRPVDQSLAEKRASVCAVCPLNVDPNWIQKMDALAAKEFKTLLEIKNDMKLQTPIDSQIKSCSACDCWLPLKVFTKLEHIVNNTSENVWKDLHEKCWIREESGRPIKKEGGVSPVVT